MERAAWKESDRAGRHGCEVSITTHDTPKGVTVKRICTGLLFEWVRSKGEGVRTA
jgi:hypothetical protein